MGGLVGVVGLAENKANSAPIDLELELGLSLAKIIFESAENFQQVSGIY